MTRTTMFLIAMTVFLAGCSSEVTDTTAAGMTATVTTPPTTTTAPTTTTVATTLPPNGEPIVRKDVVYLEMDGHEYLTDVYVPDGDGPWPVVVAFHGAMVYKSHVSSVAKTAAEAGMLAFTPNWVPEWPASYGVDEHTLWEPIYRCAMAFAQEEAPRHGGDPSHTVTYGISAGSGPASVLALNPTTDLTAGCVAQTAPVAPVGAVLGDDDYFFYTKVFDAGFDADAAGMIAFAGLTIDPASWPADLSPRVRLWAAADGSFPRTFDDPWDEDGWFAQRDPDGTIRRDLDELGQLDDGVISFLDNGLLLATRLQQAGIDATFETFPGGHTHGDKIPELVAYLLDAAGPG